MRPKSFTLSDNSYVLPLSVSEHLAFVDLFSSLSNLSDPDGKDLELSPLHWEVVTAIINCYDSEGWVLLEFLPEEAFFLSEECLSELPRKEVMKCLLVTPQYFWDAIMKASDELSKEWVDEVWSVCEKKLDRIYYNIMDDIKKKETVPEATTGS